MHQTELLLLLLWKNIAYLHLRAMKCPVIRKSTIWLIEDTLPPATRFRICRLATMPVKVEGILISTFSALSSRCEAWGRPGVVRSQAPLLINYKFFEKRVLEQSSRNGAVVTRRTCTTGLKYQSMSHQCEGMILPHDKIPCP